jgi:hypothetical protein
MFLLLNHICSELGTPHESCGSVCASVNDQLHRGFYFVGAAISSDDHPPQIPRLDRPKSFGQDGEKTAQTLPGLERDDTCR